MTYRLKALVSTDILAPILGGLQWKICALHFFQRCGTTLYIIEWTVSYVNSFKTNLCYSIEVDKWTLAVIILVHILAVPRK